ncbi:hepatocyte growth factor-regulated tyrosine kinase substrate [Culicoides brevitarsis]|uniref:hepatocyte growth factor-regulated tyrosine kinase substrate n=1 Tax=Culicoides brevitarsis TaxID=469753 RepID=UPI00307C585B
MFRSDFDKAVENATSHLHLEPDWSSMMILCDLIRQNEATPKYALAALKKKMQSTNPHTAYYALLSLESIVKNCGPPVHEEISTKASCEMFTNLIETTPHENVKNKMLELIQTWAHAFRSNHKYRAIRDTMNILKCDGHKFPELKEADAMFASDVAPEWADGECCHRCRVAFGVLQRKHHCRNCGQVFCHQCSSKTSTLPKYGFEKEVRVCEGCYIALQRGTFAPTTASKSTKDDSSLPEEYLKSSLAQQSQAPPTRTEQEIQEEEELQLALALSQSEAEEKAKLNAKFQAQYSVPRSYTAPRPPSPEPAMRSPSPNDEIEKNPELAKYLNRDYWESKQKDSPLSPTAPSPMSSITSSIPLMMKNPADDPELDEFTSLMRSQLDIFVNRMKSSSARGRNISNDTSIQALFLNISTLHSKLLTYIKEMDDKRMWYESLQDKIGQIKDSRAALDVLRQEHQEKLRRIAEEQERQRQIQMAHKLEIMRKKKQEYLQYQRQLALQRIQDQEREMQMRMEQQKAHYRMGGQPFAQQFGPAMPPGATQPPMMTMPPGGPMPGGYGNYGYPPQMPQAQMNPQQQQPQMMVNSPPQMPGQMPQQQLNPGQMPQQQINPGVPQQQINPGVPPQQPQAGAMGMMPPQMIPGPGQNHPPQGLAGQQPSQMPPQMMQQQPQPPPMAMPEQQQVQAPPIQQPQMQPPVQVVEKPAEPEPSIGELISFD